MLLDSMEWSDLWCVGRLSIANKFSPHSGVARIGPLRFLAGSNEAAKPAFCSFMCSLADTSFRVCFLMFHVHVLSCSFVLWLSVPMQLIAWRGSSPK